MRIVPQAAVPALLEVAATLDANATALAALHTGAAQTPQRIVLDARGGPSFFMPALSVADGEATGKVPDNEVLGMKIVSVRPGNSEKALPPVTGTLIVMDPATGAIRGLVDAEESTAWRTAAGSAISALVSREGRPPASLAIFGAGAQSHAHLVFFLHIFPSLTNVTIISRSPESARSVASHFTHSSPSTVFQTLTSDSPEFEQTIASSDIIITATPSSTPLFRGSLVKPGAHIVCIGSYRPTVREIDAELVERAWCIACDSRSACLKEAGELQGLEDDSRVVDVGSLYDPLGDGKVATRGQILADLRTRSRGDVTIYKSVGVAIQDVVMGEMLLRRAEERGVGIVV